MPRHPTLPLRAPHRAHPLAWAAVLLLAGCASLQSPRTPEAPFVPPAAWSQPPSGTPATLARWWERFGDPALPRLVEQALAGGGDVAVAQARLRQARAQRDLSAADRSISIGGSGSAQASRRGSSGGASSEQIQLGADARWEADLFGAGAADLRAADASAEAVAATLAATRVAVAAEVATNLLQLRGTQARAAIARQNLASQQQTLQIVQWRADAGLVTSLDVEQARTAVEQTRAQIPALESSAAQAMNALAVLTGRAPGTLGAELAPAAPALVPSAPHDLALALPAEVLRQRPDLRAAERQLVAAAARVEQADAQRLPSLSLSGSIGLNALSLGALGSGAGVASLLASVSVPIFDGGRLKAQVQSQEAARDEAAASYRNTLLVALQEVEDSLVALRGTREQLAAQTAAVESARRAATLADQRYRSGLVDFQNVLQSQRTLLAAEDNAAGTATTLATQHVRLYKALGGGWEPDDTINRTAAR
jgi:multidrug efflux system outer membrane protein